MRSRPITRTSTGRPICQECSDEIEGADRRVRTERGVVHVDCAETDEQAA